MTAISSLPGVYTTARIPSQPGNRVGPVVVNGAPPSTLVTLSADGLAAARTAPVPLAARFKDMSAAMFGALGTAATPPISQELLPKDVDHRFTLGIVTASGTQVELTLASRNDELIVRVGADGQLGDEERAALSSLAQGFQDVIDGMALDKVQIRLGELVRLDSNVLQSLDLDAAVSLPTDPPATQSLALHIDGAQRSVKIEGPEGNVDVKVDTGSLHNLGTRQQQAKAIDSYLDQFDQTTTRGRGDAHLMTMFKDAFSDLNRTATRDGPAPAGTATNGAWSLSREDRAVLTGLADFRATVAATPRWDNPARRNEVSGFEYEVSQDTKLAGGSRNERSISQSQQSRLTAQFHEPLQPGAPLAFDFSSETQNYTYHQVDDTARSNVDLQYRDGKLRHARLEQSASQSERIQQYVLGKLTSDRTIPAEQRIMRDLVASLAPYNPERDGKADGESREVREARRERALDALGDNMVLLGTGMALADRARRLDPVFGTVEAMTGQLVSPAPTQSAYPG